MIFGNLPKSLEMLGNPLVWAQSDLVWTQWAHPGWSAAARSGGARGARGAVASARGGAAGVPEPCNTLGMLLVVSLPICTAIGDP